MALFSSREGFPMRSRPERNRMCPPTRVVLPLVAAWLLAPASARSDCGDYVVIGFPDATGMTGSHDPTPAGPLPCNGPSCSEQKVPPPLAPVSTDPPQVNDRLSAANRPLPPSSPSAEIRTEEICGKPHHFGPSVFHPPR